jgi:2-(1,2-epoxy-1,2-dihydrophenyl)acetyl-CoA isomerase
MMLLGEKLPAEKAAEWGLIWKCVDDGSSWSKPNAEIRRRAAVIYAASSNFAARRAAQCPAEPDQMESEFQAQLRDSEDAQEAQGLQ